MASSASSESPPKIVSTSSSPGNLCVRSQWLWSAMSARRREQRAQSEQDMGAFWVLWSFRVWSLCALVAHPAATADRGDSSTRLRRLLDLRNPLLGVIIGLPAPPPATPSSVSDSTLPRRCFRPPPPCDEWLLDFHISCSRCCTSSVSEPRYARSDARRAESAAAASEAAVQPSSGGAIDRLRHDGLNLRCLAAVVANRIPGKVRILT